VALTVKIWMYLLEGLQSNVGFKLRGLVSPTYSASPTGENVRRIPQKFSRCKNVLEVLYIITMPSLMGLEYHAPPGRPKSLVFCLFVCLSVCLFVLHAFERQSLCPLYRHEGVGVQTILMPLCTRVQLSQTYAS